MATQRTHVTQLQQGDVCLLRIAKLPNNLTPITRSPRGFVIAEGEATGHAHVITDEVELYEANGVLYLKTDQVVTIHHEEHHPITVEPGIWRVERVREYDYFADLERQVQD